MIGTETLAQTLADATLEVDEWGDVTGGVPDGFTYLSSGAHRHAFLGPDGCVYKRETEEGECIEKNREEYDSFMNCEIPFPKNIRLAAIELFLLERPIVAMEYLETGAGAFGAHSVRTFLYGMGGEFTDVHGENVRIDKDSNWVITDW